MFDISKSAQDIIKQLLTIDFNIRYDFDKTLKHIWFEKDIFMKQNVHSFINEFSNITPSSLSHDENCTKKIKFCSCLTHDSGS